MHLFIVVYDPDDAKLSEALAHAKDALREHRYHEACPNALIVLTDIETPTALAQLLRLSESSDYTAAVFLLDGSYAGYFNTALWTWMKQARKVLV